MTGCERILARLKRGPATAAELYATTYTVVHSRIADLRKRGYSISCEHIGGTGAETYVYSLLNQGQGIPSPSPLVEQALPGETERLSPHLTVDSLAESGATDGPPPVFSGQLTLEPA